MPITVTCQTCNARLAAPDVAAGKRVKCPKCGSVIPVPAAESEFEVVEDDGFEVVDDEPPPRPRPRPRPPVEDDEDDDRPRRRSRRDEEDDEDEYDDRPKKRKKKRPNVPDHMMVAVLTTLLCCLPAGIVSIVYAAQVRGKLDAGDYRGAREASDKAKTWAWVSFGLAIAAGVVGFVIGLLTPDNQAGK